MLKRCQMACEKEMACVRGYHVCKDIWAAAVGEVLVCSREPTNVGKTFGVKLYLLRKFSYVFYVQKYFYNEKNELRYQPTLCYLVFDYYILNTFVKIL